MSLYLGHKFRVRCIGRPSKGVRSCGWTGVRTAGGCECYDIPCRPTAPGSGCPNGVVWPCPKCAGAVTGRPVKHRRPNPGERGVLMAAHILHITETDDGREYAVECPGVTDACREWRECAEKTCPANTSDGDALWDDEEAHGVRHQNIDSTWMTPTGLCYLQAADEFADVAKELVSRNKLAPGRYAVTHSFDDGRIEYLELVESAAVER